MERIELDVLSDATNQAVIQMPGRRFPGIVVQGDTLSTLVSDAKEVADRLRNGDPAVEEAEYLAVRLGEFLAHYARVLAAHEIPLPYFT